MQSVKFGQLKEDDIFVVMGIRYRKSGDNQAVDIDANHICTFHPTDKVLIYNQR